MGAVLSLELPLATRHIQLRQPQPRARSQGTPSISVSGIGASLFGAVGRKTSPASVLQIERAESPSSRPILVSLPANSEHHQQHHGGSTSSPASGTPSRRPSQKRKSQNAPRSPPPPSYTSRTPPTQSSPDPTSRVRARVQKHLRLPSPILLFSALLPKLWSLWECLVLCEPVVLFAKSPRDASLAVWWLMEWMKPVSCYFRAILAFRLLSL